VESNEDSYEYSIDGGDSSLYSVVGYHAISNSDGITITITDDGFDADSYEVFYTLGSTELQSIDVESNVISFESGLFDDYTGTITVMIVKTTTGGEELTATIHVMLVGPVVHSSLAASATSS